MLCSDTIVFLLHFLVFSSGSQDCFHVVKLISHQLDFVLSRALMYSMQYTVKKGWICYSCGIVSWLLHSSCLWVSELLFRTMTAKIAEPRWKRLEYTMLDPFALSLTSKCIPSRIQGAEMCCSLVDILVWKKSVNLGVARMDSSPDVSVSDFWDGFQDLVERWMPAHLSINCLGQNQ